MKYTVENFITPSNEVSEFAGWRQLSPIHESPCFPGAGWRTTSFAQCKALHTAVFVIAVIAFTLNDSNARAASVMPTDYRFAMAGDKFEDTWQLAVAFRMRSPYRLRAKYMELAVGTISTTEVSQPFVSFGPVWRLPINSRRLFVQLGFSPTLLGGSTFHGRDLGGKFHFTSSATVGMTFGARDAVELALRIQHMSNGSIRNTNPGMDMIGLNLSFSLGNR